ncbi:MAG: tail fiber domain-containing protein [Thermoanaerobaculia bacterium]
MQSTQRSLWTLALAVACLGLVAGAASAAPNEAVATLSAGAAGVEFRPLSGDYEKLVLTVSGPGEFRFRREFAAGQIPVFSAFGKGGQALPEGNYTYELLAVPRFAPDVRQKLAAARKAGNERAVVAELRQAGKLPKGTVQSGGFAMISGSFVVAGLEEEAGTGPRSAKEALRPTFAADQVIPDDLIVQASLCVGFDCVNNENFGFDTIRLKENNLRIKFEDTSVGSFPTNDWQLTANDSASGGQSKFSIEDITGARVPFTVEAGSTTNSIYIDSTGRVGFRTSTPVLDIHVNTSNTPAIRLEQNSSGGFTAQTWDVAGNEANFFVRDVTGGSRLPFRIRPGAPTSSVDISADGDIGIGTASPDVPVDIKSNAANVVAVRIQAQNSTSVSGIEFLEDSTITETVEGFMGFVHATNEFRFNSVNANPLTFRTANTERGRFDADGDFGIGCNAPASDLVVASGAGCSVPSSSMNAGDAQFTPASSRTFKENLSPVRIPAILEKIAGIDVYTYDFKQGPKNRMGLMAEDFHHIFGRGSDKYLSGDEVQMALWLAVKELSAENKELTDRLAALEAKLAEKGSTQ